MAANVLHTNDIREVQEQYETLPYPARKPRDEKHRLIHAPMMRLDTVSHHCFGGAATFENFRVLIAGGGTGDSAMVWGEQLLGRAGSEVVYLDMSAASMDIAQKRAAQRSLDNIKWVQGSILSIAELDLGQFDFIDCTGVLHHLKNPDEGLAALAAALKPGGAMNIMVYATYGRSAIYQIQELMRDIVTTDMDTREKLRLLRAALTSLPKHHWLNVSRQIGWFYGDQNDDAEMLDMFLHAQDRPFNIAQIHAWLGRCGLRLTSEPGTRYTQLHYLPETFVTDGELLRALKKKPLPEQQLAAERMSTKIAMHEFFCTHQARPEMVAAPDDHDMIPTPATGPHVDYPQLARIAAGQKDAFSFTLDDVMGKPAVAVPKGRFIVPILQMIDGKNSVGNIIAAVDGPPDVVAKEFKNLAESLIRGHMLYLRRPGVEPYPPIQNYERRVKNL